MKTKRIKAFLIAALLAFESIAVGVVPAGAQIVSENTVTENVGSKNSVIETEVVNESDSDGRGQNENGGSNVIELEWAPTMTSYGYLMPTDI